MLAAGRRPPAALAQGPAAPWLTIETAHFRVHYPAPFAAWAGRAAGALEVERDRAIAEIGFAPADVVDVVVSDPQADANGEALPFRGWPRLVLWTTPPRPDSEIGYYRDWIEDLVAHEEAHLVHLLRPSRNPLLASLLPVGSIALAPRWVVEGYATLIEGRLTGAGRPYGDLRAAILRRWAQAGRLPGYGALAADSHSWRGMSMAYLLGSAYLEWLEQRAGPGSLRKLWARMTARSGRRFDEAFAGIWGNTPESVYDRFRAELTYRAMAAEKRVQAVGPLAVREGALWQELTWSTGAPAVSPDGSQIAAVRQSKDRPAELVIWPAAPDAAAEKRWQAEQDRRRALDPQDVPAVRTKPLPSKPLYTWRAAGGGDPAMPRFMPGGRSLLLIRVLPDGQGLLHPDLCEWRPASGEMRRITRQGDLRDPDPSPDGAWAVAVRDRHGLSQLVTVELGSGLVRPLTEPTLDVVYDRPRLSPDGRRVAFGLHAGGSWKLAVLALATLAEGRAAGEQLELAPPAGGTAASPAWSPDGGTLYAVVGRGGFIDLYAFAVPPAGGAAGSAAPPRALTRTQGGAFAPAPTPDGKALFYLSLEPYGLDLRRLDLTSHLQSLPEIAMPADLAPAVRPSPAVPAPPPPPLPIDPGVPPPRPVGVGRQELLPLVGGQAGSAGGTLELGLRSGDLLGRLDVLALGGLGFDGASSGATLAGTWRGWPIEVSLQAWDVRELPSRFSLRTKGLSGGGSVAPSGDAAEAGGGALDLERRGIAAAAEWNHEDPGGHFRARADLLWQRLIPAASGANRALDHALSGRGTRPAFAVAEETVGPSGGATGEGVASAEASYRLSRRFGLWRLGSDFDVRLGAGRTGGGGGWSRYGGNAALAVAYRKSRLGLSWRRDGSRQVTRAADLYQLGGADSSLLPPAERAWRIVSPALPAAALLGAEHEEERAELTLGFLPVPLFYQRHRLWGGLLPRAAEVTLAGLEYRAALAPYPLVRLPAIELRVGAARVLSDPLGDRTRWWLISVWRP